MWKFVSRRPKTLQSKSKRAPYRPYLEQLEDRRLFATNITQYHVDSQSTGANLTETQLTSSNVNTADFGQLYNTTLDGQVYAEPLVMTNVTIAAGSNTVGTPGTYNSVVYVATQHDSLYALNAANGAILWHRTFLDTTNSNDHLTGASSVTTVPSGDTNSGDISPEIGITGTPVIDASTNTLYVDVKTKETVSGNAFYVQRLHAINITDGSDSASAFVIGTTTGGGENTNNTPIYVSGTGAGNVNGVVQFNALRQANRPALSLVNGVVYVAWASHGDNGPYHGWVATWNVTNLSTQGMVLSGVLCTDPNGSEGGIWGGGGGLTFDPNESFNGQPAFYFETGNGAARGGNPTLDANGFPTDKNYYESVVKVEADPTTTATSQNSNGWGLRVADYFTPYNVNALDINDEDFGSGSPLVLPDSAGIPNHPHLMVAAGKEGKIYLIDRDNLGKFNANGDAVLNAVLNTSTGISTPPVLINGSLSTPAYYHGELYWVSGYNSNAWSYIVAPNPSPNPPTVPVAVIQPTSETANGSFGYVPGSVVVSANGNEDPAGAVVWIMDTGNGEIHAYSALSLSTELWNSGTGSIATVKFAVPTVANGQVFVGTQNGLQAFGLTGASVPLQAPNAVSNLSAQALSGSSIELAWTDSTVSPNFATNYAIQESSTPNGTYTTVANAGQEATRYTVTGLSQNTTYYFRIVSSNSAGSSSASTPSASATTTNQTGATPTAPVGLGATPASGSEVYLTWTNTAANETGFTVTRATDSLFTQNVVTQTLASAPYYYTDTAAGMSPGNTYYYKIQATNASGSSGSSNTASVNIPNVPPAPTNAAAVQTGASVVLSWTDHAGPFALGYQISRSVDGGPYVIYANQPETSDAPPSTLTFTDTNVPLGHTYTYSIVAENVAGFSTAAFASAGILGSANLSLDSAGNLVLTVSPGAPDQLSVQLSAGIYTLTDIAVNITASGTGAGFVTGSGTSTVTIPAANVSAMTLDTGDGTDTIRIVSDAVPITITADSGNGNPTINLGDGINNETISGAITNASRGNLLIAGSGVTTITGNLICQNTGGVALSGAGVIAIAGNINLGPLANLTDSGSGQATITGVVSGTAPSATGLAQGLVGTYFNLGAATNLIQPAAASNSAWLGNRTPAVTARLVGPIDFPDIQQDGAAMGFTDTLGNTYYNLDPTPGSGNNNNVEARWYGNITIPGTGSTAVPINFRTGSDDGSMLYIDGSEVVNNNFFQGVTYRSGLVNLTPGLHTIDVEFYQGGGGAAMFAQWDPTGGANWVDIPNSAFSSLQAVNGVTKTGAGTLTLSNTNTYIGATTINGGSLVVTADGAMGPATAAGVFVNSGGALAFTGGVDYTTAEPTTLSGSGLTGNGAVENISGTNTFAGPITVSGAATLGADAGALTLSGNINLGLGNLTVTGSGQTTISGVISGSAPSGTIPGLIGTYFNLAAAQGQIQPAAASNAAWLGNQTPVVTAQLVGPIDFPNIQANGFLDPLGNQYYNNGQEVEARWYGDIIIPGAGATPVPINFATSSDDGSIIYIDGNVVVNNNFFQAVTQRTGLVNLTPGLHAIDIEYYQGGGGAAMNAQWDTTGGTNFADIPNSAFAEPANGLTKVGSGTLTLSNTNTYVGATTVNAGTLIVTADGAMGPATDPGAFVNSGGALAFAGGVNYTTAEPVLIRGSGPAGNGAIENISGANSFGAPITLQADATLGSDAGTLSITNPTLNLATSNLTTTGAGNLIIPSTIQGSGPPGAYVGFTAGTGGANSVQDILNWTYASGTTNINYANGFAANTLVLNGAPSVVGTALRLTDGNNNEARTAWTPTAVPFSAFTSTFEWTYGNTVAPQADGFTFAIQNSGPTAVGGGGGALGYNGIAGNSLAFEFNLYNGVSNFGVGVNGAINHPIDLTASGINFHTNPNDVYKATIAESGSTLTVSIWDTTLNSTNTPNFTQTFATTAAGANNLTKNGSGTLTLSSANTYIGATTVAAGMLLVDGQIVSPPVTVQTGGTLGGHGTVPAVTVQTGGVLSPGDSPGALTAASLSMTTGSTFLEELAGATAGAQYDQVIIPSTGSVALGGATLNLSLLNGFQPALGEQFTIVSNQGSSVGGTFSQGSTYSAGGYIFGIDYAAGSGHDVVLTVTAVPTTILGLSPNTGLAAGGTTVIITGKGFTAATAVTFGNTAAASFTVNSDTSITAVDPTGAGIVDVTVTAPGGTSPLSSADQFTYVSPDATTTTLTDNGPNPSTSGAAVSFTVTVAGGSVIGGQTVYIEDADASNAIIASPTLVGGTVTVTYNGLSVGTHHLFAQYNGDATHAGSNSSTTPVIQVVNPGGAAPAVASAAINGGTPAYLDANGHAVSLAGQNSVVEQILVTFNEAVTLDPGAFTVTNDAAAVTVNNGPSPNTAAVTASFAAVSGSGNTQFIVTFSGPGTTTIPGGTGNVIKDGLYILNTVGSHVHANGQTAADNNTTFWALYGSAASDNVLSTTLGDGNSEVFVDNFDYSAFKNTFGSESDLPAGPPVYNPALDGDLNGFVDNFDYSAFKGNFGADWSF